MDGNCGIESTPATSVMFVEVSRIQPDRQPWHVRRTYRESEVAALAEAIHHSGYVEPLEVHATDSSDFRLVSGWLRLLALQRLIEEGFPDRVPVLVLEEEDPMELLLRLYLAGSVRFPLKTLEIGWAMHTLEGMLRERRQPAGRADICARLQLTDKKSLASEAWSAAEAVPLWRAEEAERKGELSVQRVASAPRSALREIRQAPPEVVPVLREALLEAIQDRVSPVKVVRAAREQLSDERVLEAVTRQVASGQSARKALAQAAAEHGSRPFRLRVRATALRVPAGMAFVLRKLAAALGRAADRLSRVAQGQATESRARSVAGGEDDARGAEGG